MAILHWGEPNPGYKLPPLEFGDTVMVLRDIIFGARTYQTKGELGTVDYAELTTGYLEDFWVDFFSGNLPPLRFPRFQLFKVEHQWSGT